MWIVGVTLCESETIHHTPIDSLESHRNVSEMLHGLNDCVSIL